MKTKTFRGSVSSVAVPPAKSGRDWPPAAPESRLCLKSSSRIMTMRMRRGVAPLRHPDLPVLASAYIAAGHVCIQRLGPQP
ncbi:hypothetical protein AK812_SmicGene7861 [Symbiodinium microadriaticum]|uniref:Uncharacterized protein n=1 Tax=Symbiodinium microadriaticum TaxID=2951 RepID=A0A1Q9EMJ6_SYMMI|nr:hypothetical protein AK812_SmicGene7861 [Symbiodinium microadriaticum]